MSKKPNKSNEVVPCTGPCSDFSQFTGETPEQTQKRLNDFLQEVIDICYDIRIILLLTLIKDLRNTKQISWSKYGFSCRGRLYPYELRYTNKDNYNVRLVFSDVSGEYDVEID